MILHPSRATLLAYDTGDLPPRRVRRVAGHLADCPRCRASLAWRREVREVVADVTSPQAPDVLPDILRRLDEGESLLLPGAERPGPAAGLRRGRRAALAAVVALVVAAGSAVAAVRAWEHAPLRSWLGLAGPAPAERPVTGIDVRVPAAGMEVVLEDVHPEVTLTVEPGEGALLAVSVAGANPQARFRLGVARVTVRGVREGEILLSVPRDPAGPVRVTSGSVDLAVVQGGSVRMRGREPASTGRVPVGDLLRGARRGGAP